ncbi:MAG: ethylbenzene dehydrogenase-related protein [Halomonas sp.]|uniref:ethylbenzene dehydrogenase-related protein n=1 Tax=Halomonas sp. TaxID=1486246 RepID=UPI002ACD521C|nr:ethylbenzene dehydrogenase-related protein [Halomonas sp.]MDZ7851217.1 ethylbenzene dehydrogenase-related protein [Halomonas sp.]
MAQQDKSAIPWLAFGVPIALGLAWVTQGTGVIENDLERNIYIPEELTMPLQVQAAHNGRQIFFRYRWPAEQPHVYHDMLRYEDGEWIRHGSSSPWPDPDGTYEDRVAMLVDDGGVPDFGRYGGYITVGDRMRFFSDSASPAEVSEHPHLGQEMGKSDVRKYLPATRSDQNDWRSVVDADVLETQREAGYFLDLWHWRAGRSNPIGASDDQWIGEYRNSDEGSGPYTTNWDGDNDQPRWMLDPEETGQRALRWEDVESGEVDFDGIYYLSEDNRTDFDPDHDWQNGDVIPRRLLRELQGSRGSISVHGQARWEDGYWDVTLVRDMDTGNPLDDKAFHEQGIYDVGIGVYRNATGSRWHYVSHPYTVGLGRDADFQAEAFNGRSPDWSDDWFEMTLFYPGQVDWPTLISRAHAGAEDIAENKPVRPRHSEKQLALYGVEMEFREAITSHWWMTLIAGLIAMLGTTLALLPSFRSTRQGDRS